ncbi:MAG: Abi family protein [Candidatus Scalindua sp.]|nr:Abi family protein [Candidatus Scalindua sp.]
MRYEKPPLTFSQQADLLIGRGLIADRSILIEKLKAVSYYRLSGYWYPFRNTDNSFKPGTTLEKIWERYTFDRQLRLLVIDTIERVEVSVRTSLIYHLSHAHGPFAYTDYKYFSNITSDDHNAAKLFKNVQAPIVNCIFNKTMLIIQINGILLYSCISLF